MPAKTTSYQVTDKLYLVRQDIGNDTPKKPAVDPATNHVAVVDCSGSMYYELPKIREQIKKRIPKLLKAGDTLSLIWFSGRNEYGVLFEAEPIASLTELKEINGAIDRFLKPVGLTGFKEPIEEVKRMIDRIGKKNKNGFALFFMSDGYDNVWNRADILKAVEATAAGLASATFVEYGNYADRQLLSKMAEKAGGSLIAAENFDRYIPAFEAAMSRTASTAKRVDVDISGDAIGGFAFALRDGELLSYEVEEGTVAVAEDQDRVWYMSPTSVGVAGPSILDISKEDAASDCADKTRPNSVVMAGVYAAISLFSVRAQPQVVLPLLKATGDVRLITQFGGCFGKQAYTAFMDASKDAAFTPTHRYVEGRDPSKVPPDDAYTVLHFLKTLSSDDSNRVLLDSKDFVYTRIGRPAIPVVEKDAEGKDLPALEFEAEDAPDGYAVSSLTYNEEQPNISILVKKAGTVDLTKRLKGSGFEKKVPKKFPTSVYRNYAIIRSGVVNVERLPVRMTAGTVKQLIKEGFPLGVVEGLDGEDAGKAVERIKKASDDRPVSFCVNLRQIPIVNRNMVQTVSAKTLFEKDWALTKLRASQKVYNAIKKERFPRESEGFKIVYGEECAAWLQSCGITDYSGFGPKTEKGAASDKYMGKELKVSLKGLSSIPSVKEAREKIASGKTTPRHDLLRPAIKAIDDFEKSDVLAKAKDKDKVYEAWLDDQLEDTKKQVKALLYEVSQIRFGVCVGQTWLFPTLDENSMDVQLDGQKILCTAEMREIEIEV